MSTFTRLDQSSATDWTQISAAHVRHFTSATPMRIMDQLRGLSELVLGFPCDQLHHSLMTATLARAEGADDETVVTALCHDVGKTLSVPNHGAIAAEILRPYVSDDHYWAVRHHQAFQGHYYYSYLGRPADMREAHRDAGWYALAEKLVDGWDMPAFDPDFAVDPLESFEPLVIKLFSTPRILD